MSGYFQESQKTKTLLMEKIITLLMNIVNKNIISYKKNYLPEPYTPFDNLLPLSISNYLLLTQIVLDERIEENILVYSLMLLDKFSKSTEYFYPFTEKNILLLEVCGLMITQKFLYDVPFKNDFFSEALNISLCELNKAEALFLECIDHNVFLKEDKLYLYKCLINKVVI